MNSMHDNMKETRGAHAGHLGLAPTDEEFDDELDDPDQAIPRTRWLRAVLGGFTALMLAFIVLFYFVDWRSLVRPGRSGSAATAPTPLKSSLALKAAFPAAASSTRILTDASPLETRPVATTRPESPLATRASGGATTSAALTGPRSTAPRVQRVVAPAPSTERFWIQVGAFTDSKAAARLAARLTAARYPVMVRQGASGASPHLVWVGRYSDRGRAAEVRTALERKGFRGFILKEDGRSSLGARRSES